MSRRPKAVGRFVVKGGGREHVVPTLGAALAVALDWAARLTEAGSVVVRDVAGGEVVAVARGDGTGTSHLYGG